MSIYECGCCSHTSAYGQNVWIHVDIYGYCPYAENSIRVQSVNLNFCLVNTESDILDLFNIVTTESSRPYPVIFLCWIL